jgi:hypothetical protein
MKRICLHTDIMLEKEGLADPPSPHPQLSTIPGVLRALAEKPCARKQPS